MIEEFISMVSDHQEEAMMADMHAELDKESTIGLSDENDPDITDLKLDKLRDLFNKLCEEIPANL